MPTSPFVTIPLISSNIEKPVKNLKGANFLEFAMILFLEDLFKEIL